VRVDQWIPEESRWNGDRRTASVGRPDTDSADIVTVVMDVIAGIIAWP
jgi:hypothetical protein